MIRSQIGNKTICDDREPITIEQAIDRLWNGKIICISDPPDYSADEDDPDFGRDFFISLNDIQAPGTWEKLSKERCFEIIREYLRGYDLYS